MKILILKRNEERYPNERELVECPGHDMTLLSLESSEQKDLESYLEDKNIEDYDRVVLRLKFAFIKKQTKFLRTIKNLVIIEEDSTVNFVFNSRYLSFENFYHKLPQAKVLVTGLLSSIAFQKQGIRSVYVPKAYNENVAYFEKPIADRSIEYGFVGTTIGHIYQKRRETLAQFAKQVDLQISLTSNYTEYRERLNDIKFFINSDKGFNEYMIKNFEALACGCILVTTRIYGEEVLGFRDMENVVLYTSIYEAIQKMEYIKNDSSLLERISANAVELAKTLHTQEIRNQKLCSEIEATPSPFIPKDKRNILRKMLSWIMHR